VNNMDWREPYSTSAADRAAALVEMEKWVCGFADPVYGVDGVHDYPDSMKRLLPDLPSFTEKEKADLAANRPDYFGQNTYGANFVRAVVGEDGGVVNEVVRDGTMRGQSTWLYAAGWGFRQLLNFVSRRYSNPRLFVTEFGFSVQADDSDGGRYDPGRLNYYAQYLSEAHKALHEDGVALKGMYAWSLMDNYEWERGYLERFGVVFTDFQFGQDPNSPNPDTPVYNPFSDSFDGPCGVACATSQIPDPSLSSKQTRLPKNSALWLQQVWKTGALADPAYFETSVVGASVAYAGRRGRSMLSGDDTKACLLVQKDRNGNEVCK